MQAKQSILFSIIVPTYNRSEFISSAIDSVIGQTYENWELLIINDGSTDNTPEVISQYTAKERRIRYFRQENRGRSAARNLGIEHAKGEYICFLDDDDYYIDNFLAEFYAEIKLRKEPEAVFLCRQLEEENGNLFKRDKYRNKYIDNLILMYLRYSNVQSLCTSKTIFSKFKFDERFSVAEDFHLFARIMLHFPVFYINKYLCVYLIHEKGTMYNELKKEIYINIPYNRIDVFDDLISKNQELLLDKGLARFINVKYNKIVYFYASAFIKKCKIARGLKILYKMKAGFFSFMCFYYFFSILIRSPYYIIKCAIK